MSSPITGADLGHLDDLAAQYSATGGEVATRADELRRRVATSVSSYRDTMDRLRAETEHTTTAMEDEIADLAATAGSVAWTGANRVAFDDELARFAAEVRRGTGAIIDGVDELRAGGVERFAALLEELGAAITAAGDGVELAATDVRTAVATQREALHQAGELGWTAA
jgi:uncharacterized protein YukE